MPAAKKPARRPAKKPAAIDAATLLATASPAGDVTLHLGTRRVEITHLERAYWPAEGITKGRLIQYYVAVADVIMPYLTGRPAILLRYPNGVDAPSFYQHDVASAPRFVRTEPLVSETGRKLRYAVYTDVASLVYLVNLGTVAQNPWHSTVARLDTPDYLVLDLDPKNASFESVREVAMATRAVLAETGLEAFAKTSGSTGIHIYVPLVRRYTYERVAAAAEKLAGRVAARVPRIATVERRLSARGAAQVYVDWQQNARGKSAASAYSVRARPGATVSAPVTWSEVEQGIAIADFDIATVPARLARVGDLWAPLFGSRQPLPKGL